ncbi:unnamed protein product [Porites lobata]|uniref:F5/8 type C domain-containing protein n=1 Tax=Porites lobata TaxID=104759 RepID=A0ABN8RYP7_9CNID|nr:unnamed protein product [Porites lobata]
MTASSEARTLLRASNGRVNMKKGWYRWCPSTKSDQSDYLQVDIGAVRNVCAVATQSRHSEHAKTYYLQISVDGVNWNTYEENKAKKVFQASTVLYSVVQQKLSQVVKARFVRFFPITYNGWPCLAVEIYVLTHGS